MCNPSIAYPPVIRLSDAAETYIPQLANDLAVGVVQLHQLSPGLAEFYWLAFFAGQASHDELCAGDLERIRWQRDAYYFVAFNRGKTLSDFYTHTTDALWAEAAA